MADMERHYYAMIAAGAQWKDDVKDPLGDQVRRFEERIGLRDDPQGLALELHKQWLAERGIEWDDTPVGSGSGQWWDQDVEFTSMGDLDKNGKRKGKQ